MQKRRFILINPKFQLTIILFFSVIFVISQAAIFISVNYFFQNFKELGIKSGLDSSHIFFKFINDQQGDINLLLFFVSISVSFLFIAGGYELSRRIAGPLYRLTKEMKEINKDNKKHIQFRKKDFFPEISKAINEMIDRL